MADGAVVGVFADPPGIEKCQPELLDDPLERAAIALYNMGHMTPEEVGVYLARRDRALVKAWCGGPGMLEPDRHLYRRRAALVLRTHAGEVPEP